MTREETEHAARKGAGTLAFRVLRFGETALATLREIRKRIRSVQSIAKVTRAMQTVSASKMRRAQLMTLSTRPYAEKSWEVLGHLAARLSPEQVRALPLLRPRPVRAIEVLLIAGSRGLCGGYNHNVIDAAMSFAQEQTVPVRFVTVGRKGREYLHRYGCEIVADFDLPDPPSADDARPIAHLLRNSLEQGRADQVWIAGTEYVSTLVQRPRVQRLLPIEAVGEVDASAGGVSYIFEPSVQSILDSMLQRFVDLRVYLAILEALASEHSARMVAMRNATDNAHSLIGELTMAYNKARQEAITKELIDIVGGAAALTQAGAVR